MKAVAIAMIVGLISNPAYSGECPNAVDLKLGDRVTDCDRVGLRRDYADQLRRELIEGEYNRKIVDEQKRLIDVKDLAIRNSNEQSELWRLEAMRGREELDKARSSSNVPFFVGLASGVALVLASAWAVGQVGR